MSNTPHHGINQHNRALRLLALGLAALLLAPLLTACGGGEDLEAEDPAIVVPAPPPINCAAVPRPKACI